MLEEEIKKLTEAIKELTARMGSTTTAPAETEVPVEVAPVKKKKKAVSKKKKTATEELDEIVARDAPVKNIQEDAKEMAASEPDVTKDDLLAALRANVKKRQGDEFAKEVFEKYQPGATMSSLDTKNYDMIFAEIDRDNKS